MKPLRIWLAMLLAVASIVFACSCGLSEVRGYPGYHSRVDWVEYESSLTVRAVCTTGVYYGSAVAVSPKHALTAAHVVECEGGELLGVAVHVRNQDWVTMTVDAFADGADAARLVTADGHPAFTAFARLNTDMQDIGSHICLVVNQVSLIGQRKCGDVSTRNEEQLVVVLHVVQGNSGGPAYDASGRIVGIVSRGIWAPSMENLVELVPAAKLKALVP